MIELSQPTTHCPLCKRSNRHAQLSPEANGAIRYYFCPCGLYYAASYMTEEDTHAWYESGEYRQILSGAPGVSEELIRSENEHAEHIAPLIYERIYKYTKILDIGFSSGILLEELRRHYQCEAHGVEWSWRLREECQKRDINCYASMDEVTEHYPLIILSHVLEHTLQPMELLREIYTHLTGRLFVQVPLIMPGIAHPLVFTEASAVLMLERAGYKILSSRAEQHFSIWAVKAVDNGE